MTAFAVSCSNRGQDPKAFEVIEQLSADIGSIDALSFRSTTSYDMDATDGTRLQRNRMAKVYIEGPDKMHAYIQGDSGRAGLWFNGQRLTWYRFDHHTFDTVSITGTVLEMIDKVHQQYNVEFPSADFFYPSLADDIRENYPFVRLVGSAVIDGEDCWHIVAKNSEHQVQMWILQAARSLPKRLLVVNANGSRFESTFHDWVVNPELPESTFRFTVPDDAIRKELKTLQEGT
jgi:hypothetical protein